MIIVSVEGYSRCLCSFFRVEYSSLSSLPMPSMSMLGMFDGVCLLCGGITFTGFSKATSPMMYGCSLSNMRGGQIAKGSTGYKMRRVETEDVVARTSRGRRNGKN